jgi:hypothetical protein
VHAARSLGYAKPGRLGLDLFRQHEPGARDCHPGQD